MPKELWGAAQGGLWRKKSKQRSHHRSRSCSRSPSRSRSHSHRRHHSRRDTSPKMLVVQDRGASLTPGTYLTVSSPSGHSGRSRSSRRSRSNARSSSSRSSSSSYRSTRSLSSRRSGSIRHEPRGRDYRVPIPGPSSYTDSQGYGQASRPAYPGNYQTQPAVSSQASFGPAQAPYQYQQRSYVPPPAPTPPVSNYSPSVSVARSLKPSPPQYPAAPALPPSHRNLGTIPSQQYRPPRPPIPSGFPPRPQPSVPMHSSGPRNPVTRQLPPTNPPQTQSSPTSNLSRIQDIHLETLKVDIANDKLAETLAKQEKLRRDVAKLEEENLRDASQAKATAETRRLAEQKVELLEHRASRVRILLETDDDEGVFLVDDVETLQPARRARSALLAGRARSALSPLPSEEDRYRTRSVSRRRSSLLVDDDDEGYASYDDRRQASSTRRRLSTGKADTEDRDLDREMARVRVKISKSSTRDIKEAIRQQKQHVKDLERRIVDRELDEVVRSVRGKAP